MSAVNECQQFCIDWSEKMIDASRQRGRPREFDRDQVLDRAVSTFWAYGYAAASLDVLTESMGINRPSLYSTFGNKHELFMAAIDRYAATIGRRQITSLINEPDIRRAVGNFFEEVVRCVTSKDQPAGCLIACVAIEEAEKNAEVRNKISCMVAQTDDAIARRLRLAQDEGQLSQQVNPHSLARMILSIIQSLALRARIGASRDELSALAKDFIMVLFPA